jgi:hypothetical protein
MKKSSGSLKALDWANLFMADLKYGVGTPKTIEINGGCYWE